MRFKACGGTGLRKQKDRMVADISRFAERSKVVVVPI